MRACVHVLERRVSGVGRHLVGELGLSEQVQDGNGGGVEPVIGQKLCAAAAVGRDGALPPFVKAGGRASVNEPAEG